MSDPTPTAGWYPDPARSDLERYWDGAAWSSETRTIGAAPAEDAGLPPERASGARRTAVVAAVVAALVVVAGVGAFALLGEGSDPPPLAVETERADAPTTEADDVTDDPTDDEPPESAADPDEPSEPAPTPTETPSELEDLPEVSPTRDAGPTLEDGLQDVFDEGHIPTDRHAWDLDRRVQVIIATVPGRGESAHIFIDGGRIGRDLLDPSHRIEVADVGPSSVVLRYAVFESPGSDRCCPDGATTVEYVWDGILTPIDDIPSADPSDPWARN